MAGPSQIERARKRDDMNNTHSPSVTLVSRLKRLAVAGVISTFIYCCLTFAIWLLPFALPAASAAFGIRYWTVWLLIMLSVPGFAFGLLGGGIFNPPLGNDGTFLLAVAANLVLWFSLGAIPAITFRQNKLAVIIWIVLVAIVEILGWIIASIIFRDLTL